MGYDVGVLLVSGMTPCGPERGVWPSLVSCDSKYEPEKRQTKTSSILLASSHIFIFPERSSHPSRSHQSCLREPASSTLSRVQIPHSPPFPYLDSYHISQTLSVTAGTTTSRDNSKLSSSIPISHNTNPNLSPNLSPRAILPETTLENRNRPHQRPPRQSTRNKSKPLYRRKRKLERRCPFTKDLRTSNC